MKKLTALMMSLLMLLLCAACAPKEQLTVNVAAMKGPTGIGMAQLSSLAEEGKTEYNYSITYAGSPDEVTGGLISGELDIAAVPVNLGYHVGRCVLAAQYSSTKLKVRYSPRPSIPWACCT